jgi:hypothetical protein
LANHDDTDLILNKQDLNRSGELDKSVCECVRVCVRQGERGLSQRVQRIGKTLFQTLVSEKKADLKHSIRFLDDSKVGKNVENWPNLFCKHLKSRK